MSSTTVEGLKIFCDVIRQRSFSRGAAINRVSQSAASQAVLHLEKRLGVRLIDRSKRPLALTAEGQLFFEGCKEVVDRFFALEERLMVRRLSTSSRITVASIYSVVLYDVNSFIKKLAQRYPQDTVRFMYLHPDDVYERVLSEEADLGLISFPRPIRELEVIPWREDPMMLVCSPAHRLARLPRAMVDHLKGEDFVAFESSLAIRRHIDRVLRENKVEVNVVMEFDNIEFIKRGIESSDAVSILPTPTVEKEVQSGSLVIVPVAGLELTRPLAILHRRKKILSPAVESLIQILLENAPPRPNEAGPRDGANGQSAAALHSEVEAAVQ
ncbi:MAG: LysR family transcriptional regulator [Candidatus Sumerlaeota bacterium]|nr:LysR family transcriptional regulator [Candidatus Sumerlaeota bacterium]